MLITVASWVKHFHINSAPPPFNKVSMPDYFNSLQH